MFQFDNTYNKHKLYNLFEALSLDDFDFDSETPNEAPSNIASSDYVDVNPFDDFVKARIIGNLDTPLNAMEQILIKNVNNDTIDEYTGKVIVNDENELKTIMQKSLKYFGFEGNYNWINTSKVTKMVRLFPLILGTNISKFNGDISKWDVSNVTNMFYTFKDCSSLTCDISNWDTSKVKYWSSESYAGTPKVFQDICKKLKMPAKVLRYH